MFDIEFIVPYKNLLDIVMEAFEEFPSKEDIKLHVQVMDSTEMKEHTFFGHAIIARGLTAQYIKSLNLNQPLIELPISGYDVIRTITTALASYDAKHIAFIGAPDMIYGAQALELFFKRKITVHPFNIKDDLGSLISHCSKLGADLFIGGNTVFKRASTAGHNAVRVESGKEAVRQALNEGLRA
jgi:propionate catabolism operon transcriptional regulator